MDVLTDGIIHYQLIRFCQIPRLGFYTRNTLTPLIHEKAISTVVYTQKSSQNCIQAHEDGAYILPHINLYLSMRQGPHPHSPGHRTNSFLKFSIPKNSVFED